MATGPLSPAEAPAALVELSRDVRAAVLADPGGAPLGHSGVEDRYARALAEAAVDLFRAVDRASPARTVEQIEAQVEGGSVYARRDPRHTLAAVADRGALSALALMDLGHVLARVEP